MKTAARILVSILLVTLFLGCSLTERELSPERRDLPDKEKGSVTIVFNGGPFPAKTLVPGMEIKTYDVVGNLVDGDDNFQKTIKVGQSFSQSGLTPGVWTITVDAINEDGIIIGRGGTTADITPWSTTTVQIQIAPLSEQGTLDLKVQGPKKAFDSIDATLTPAITPDGTLEFTIEKDPLEGTYLNSAIPAGYYLLTLHLFSKKVRVWGIAEAVRILAGATTTQTYTYPPSN